MKGTAFWKPSTFLPASHEDPVDRAGGLDSAIYAINRAGLHRYIEKPWEAEDLNLSIQSC